MPYTEVFKKELALIVAEPLRELVIAVLAEIHKANPGFFTQPASKTGNHHPAICNGCGGLVLHTKRTVYFAARLAEVWGLTQNERDCALCAAILHDIWKTDFMWHSRLAAEFIEGVARERGTADVVGFELVAEIISAVRYHMGRWAPENCRKPVAEYTPVELVLHVADFFSATKDVGCRVDFEELDVTPFLECCHVSA